MASDGNDRNGMSRRDFTTRLGAAAAGVVVGSELFGSRAGAAPDVSGRILGANDRVVTASIGIRGQGDALKRGFARLKNVEIKTLCDIDANLADLPYNKLRLDLGSRLKDARLKDVPTFKPGFEQDLRKVLDDKDIDAVVIAVPNHWHALASVWAMQAGKHVYVEKPASHTVWEGRRMADAATRYNRIVQVGTMNRSRPVVIEAIKFIQDGGLGKVYLARGLCFKRRPGIGKYPDGPMAAGEKFRLNDEARDEPVTYDAQYLSKVDYDMWLGPAPKRPFNRNRFHYNWHWHWEYGNGDTGNQGPHQFDVARWGLGKNEHPVKITSMGGYFGPQPTSQETPDLHDAMFEYADGTLFEFSTRGQFTNDEGTQRIGNLFYGTKGWLYVDGDGREWQSYMGTRNEKGPGGKASRPDETGGDPNVLTSMESPHYQNFVDAIRANDPKVLACDILEGHLSSTLPHLANIAYLAGHTLVFDGKTETFKDDKKADALLTREYRKGYEIPKSFS